MLSDFTFRTRQAGLMGPVLLVSIGVLFLLSEFVPGLGIEKTWPVLMVEVGLVRLIESGNPPRPPQGPRI